MNYLGRRNIDMLLTINTGKCPRITAVCMLMSLQSKGAIHLKHKWLMGEKENEKTLLRREVNKKKTDVLKTEDDD